MNTFDKIGANGEAIALPYNGIGIAVETISEDTTLTFEDSGKTFILSNATGEAITLPAPSAGLNFKFITGLAFATDDWTITATASVIQGTVIVNGASVLGANENTITFAAAAESVGDFVELVSDGTNWYVSGVGSAASSITLTDV